VLKGKSTLLFRYLYIFFQWKILLNYGLSDICDVTTNYKNGDIGMTCRKMIRITKRILLVVSLLAFKMEQSKAFLSTSSANRFTSTAFQNSPLKKLNILHAIEAVTVCKDELLNLLSSVPSGIPTPKGMSISILSLVQQLELKCPTPDDLVIPSLQGSWELLWTAQDTTLPEANRAFMRSWINPLENQSYSNNPDGQSNPFLPISVQRQLERWGIPISATPVRSTQAIDLKNGMIRNIVALQLVDRINRKVENSITSEKSMSSSPFDTASSRSRTFSNNSGRLPFQLSFPTRASLTVDIRCQPDPSDLRRVNVKFQTFRINVPGTPFSMEMVLGEGGPKGWLRTVYIDNDLRISRGHKGSIFVMSRPRRAAV
jgi:PAP_fibrillin